MRLILQDKPKEIEVHTRDLLKRVENQLNQLQNRIDSIEESQTNYKRL